MGYPIENRSLTSAGSVKNPSFHPLRVGLGYFHLWLSRLGKTKQQSDPVEWNLLKAYEPGLEPAPKLPNPVFFLDIEQLNDTNETRALQLRRDLQTFLGLTEPLGPVKIWLPPSNKDEAVTKTAEEVKERKQAYGKTKTDICKDEYAHVRAELIRIGKDASHWIRRYFLKSEEVAVSSPEFLEDILESWSSDPCMP
jgi:hypothetical protein